MDSGRNSKRASISFGSSQRKSFANNFLAGGSHFNTGSNNSPCSGAPGDDGLDGSYVNRSPIYSPLDFSNGMNNNAGVNGFQQQALKNSYTLGSNMTNNNGNMLQGNDMMMNSNSINNNNNYVCNYNFHFPLFGLDWSMDDFVCVSSYKEDSRNKLQVIQSNDLVSWQNVAESDITYPISNIQWLPSHLHPRQLATGSDSLRIWSLNDETGSLQEQINLSLYKHKKQRHSNKSVLRENTHGNGSSSWDSSILGELPPVTSFHWNPIDTNLLVSSSIDTTCIVWDLQSSNYVKTQLIAHDSEVYDVRFLAKSTHLFASCGGDGSVRVFDLRSLAHSTIIYEPAAAGATMADITGQKNALLRLEPSPTDPNVLATFVSDTNKILILDMRNPESPVMTLEGHSSSINQIKWHPTKRNVLLSCGDDCQVLYWDLNTYLGKPNLMPKPSTDVNMMSGDEHASIKHPEGKVLDTPNQFYSNSTQEINNIVWRPQRGDWFGFVSGKKFENVKV